jgi:hypothetical protein
MLLFRADIGQPFGDVTNWLCSFYIPSADKEYHLYYGANLHHLEIPSPQNYLDVQNGFVYHSRGKMRR